MRDRAMEILLSLYEVMQPILYIEGFYILCSLRTLRIHPSIHSSIHPYTYESIIIRSAAAKGYNT